MNDTYNALLMFDGRFIVSKRKTNSLPNGMVLAHTDRKADAIAIAKHAKGFEAEVAMFDPGWEYRNKRTGGNLKSGACQKYNTMLAEKVACIPVEKLMAKNSIMFLWTTVPLLPEALDVLAAWGYQYKTSLFWHKEGRQGLGFHFSGVVEMCLVGFKGKVPALKTMRKNIFVHQPTKHSVKPPEIYDTIKTLLSDRGYSRFVEGFARKTRSGWSCYGDY